MSCTKKTPSSVSENDKLVLCHDYFSGDEIPEKLGKIFQAEEAIEDKKELYLITWSPSPSDLPNADFNVCHDFNVQILVDYCKACSTAIWCVESTQKGNPHYHGFYQVSEDYHTERIRQCIIKVLQRFGRLDITKSKGMYKRHNYWTSHANCLYYYKKETLTRQLRTPNSVIDKDCKPKEDNWAACAWMFVIDGKRQAFKDLEEKLTLRNYYKAFYFDTRGDEQAIKTLIDI